MARLIAVAIGIGLAATDMQSPRATSERTSLPAGTYGIRGVGFAIDGKSVFTTDGHYFRLWDWRRPEEIAAIDIRAFPIGKALICPDNTQVIGLGGEGVRSWNVETRKRGETLLFRNHGYSSFAISKDGRLLAAVPVQGRTIVLMDLKTKRMGSSLHG
ncbi:MAG: WD40 repeat domain-containing protein [Gemmataceae bacterium]|nr:WD40 repeat domain-containing protein [Gemmataceae bacterium]